MPELRIDPISGRRVYVAEDRAGRPTDFGGDAIADEILSSRVTGGTQRGCPFCRGNEDQTPHESAVVRDDDGGWRIRVVPNKYPAVSFEAEPAAAFGAHEVIIEAPDHLADVLQLDADHFAQVLRMYRDRLAHWAADGRLRHGMIFKNSGQAAGASLRHVHSQLAALPYVPAAVATELGAAEAFFRGRRECVFCDLVEREVASGERLVLRQRGIVAYTAYAGRQPFETWILPEEHAARFDQANDRLLDDLATALHEVLRRLDAASPGAAYNLVLHSGPFDSSAEDFFHWHWELIPRLTQLAGLELGAGVFINPLSPERAAQQLRDCRI